MLRIIYNYTPKFNIKYLFFTGERSCIQSTRRVLILNFSSSETRTQTNYSVFLNAGTPHWVQADGFCNNIAWNCLPMQKFHVSVLKKLTKLTHLFKFDIAVERYELNLQRKFQSLVPMERVTWNLAAAGLELDFEMFASVRYFLQRSMFSLANLVKTIKLKGTRIIQQVNRHVLTFRIYP